LTASPSSGTGATDQPTPQPFPEIACANLATLKKLRLRPAELARTGVRPDLGIVSLEAADF
jgi:hypothetical protein